MIAAAFIPFAIQEHPMQGYVRFTGVLLIAASAGVSGAENERGSLQDAHPACRERHSNIPQEHCVIRDRLPPSQHARRFGGAVVLIEPALSAPVEQQATNEANRAPPAPPR
ncbi:MAG: hypothetical protein ACT4PS_13905 [Betaproteobacteria bacterium]